jgi:hypothetical protein
MRILSSRLLHFYHHGLISINLETYYYFRLRIVPSCNNGTEVPASKRGLIHGSSDILLPILYNLIMGNNPPLSSPAQIPNSPSPRLNPLIFENAQQSRGKFRRFNLRCRSATSMDTNP